MSVLELIRDVSTAETMASQSALAHLPPPDRLVTVSVEKKGQETSREPSCLHGAMVDCTVSKREGSKGPGAGTYRVRVVHRRSLSGSGWLLVVVAGCI